MQRITIYREANEGLPSYLRSSDGASFPLHIFGDNLFKINEKDFQIQNGIDKEYDIYKIPTKEVADEYMRCGELCDLRAEHLYELKQMYEKNNRPKSALKIGELLKSYRNPYPDRLLFINPQAYSDVHS